MILSIVAIATASQPTNSSYAPVETIAMDAGMQAVQLEVQGVMDRDDAALAESLRIYEALARIEQDATARAQAQLSAAGVATALGDVTRAQMHLTAVEESGPARLRAEAKARRAELM